MNTIVAAICSCYSFLLVLYPRRLRDKFGSDMVAMLRQQLLDGFEAEGLPGTVRAAGGAFGELVTIGIPSTLKNETLAIFPMAICTSFVMLYSLSAVLYEPDILDPLMRRLGLQCP